MKKMVETKKEEKKRLADEDATRLIHCVKVYIDKYDDGK